MPDLKILTPHPIQYQVPVFRRLISRGIDIEVMFYHPGSAGRKGFDREAGIEIEWDVDLLSGYSYQTLLDASASYSLLEQLRIFPQLLIWSMTHRSKPLLIMGWFMHSAVLIWILRILTASPVLILGETNLQSFGSSPKSASRLMLQRWLIRNSHAVFAIGTRTYEFWREMGQPPERIFKTPYSIDNDYWNSQWNSMITQRRNLAQEYGLNPDLPTYLFVGKLIPKKRPVELLDAFLKAGLGEKAQLVYVGTGELESELLEKIRKAGAVNVHLLGFFNQSQMPVVYVLGELLVLLSDATETWGLVVNEALACQRPVIVAETVGCSTDLVFPENGWQIPLDDSKAIADTLLRAYESYHQWNEMGIKGLQIVKGYTFDAMANGIQEALNALETQDKSK